MKTNRKARRAGRELYRFCLVDGTLDAARAREVARRIAASRRRGAIHVLSEFHRLVRLDRDRHTAFVESAMPLADATRADVRARLVRAYGASVNAVFGEKPSLIGGLRIKVGSDVYDGTIRARLAALQARL